MPLGQADPAACRGSFNSQRRADPGPLERGGIGDGGWFLTGSRRSVLHAGAVVDERGAVQWVSGTGPTGEGSGFFALEVVVLT